MTQLSKSPYKGCRDLFPKEKREQNFMFDAMKDIATVYSYEPYDGPLLEMVDLYKAKSGEELINDQIYSFQDRGDRFVAIRPEMTPTVARMVAQIHKQTPKPIRWFSTPNLMRYERPQKGRLREHWQFNCDIFGAPEVLGELEILNLLKDFLKHLGANQSHFSILINDRALVDNLFDEKLKVSKEVSYKLYKIIDKAKKVSPEKLETMMSEVINEEQIKILKEYLSLDNFDAAFHFFNFDCTLDQLISKSKDSELFKYLEYDPTIVRGLDYYTGIVFEVFDLHPDNKRAICGGGSYANLLQIFNESPLGGCGFGLGDVTLKDFLKTHNLLPDLSLPEAAIFICYGSEKEEKKAFEFAQNLRDLGFVTEVNLGVVKINKAFQIAEKKEHPYILICEENSYKIKNLKEKNEISFTEINDDVLNFIDGN